MSDVEPVIQQEALIDQLCKVRDHEGIESLMSLVMTLNPAHLPAEFQELFDLVKAQTKALKKFRKEYKCDPDAQVDRMIACEGLYYTIACKTTPGRWYRPRHSIYRAWQRVHILDAEIEDFCQEHLDLQDRSL